MIKLFILLSLLSLPLYAQESALPSDPNQVLTVDTKESKRFNPRKSHWLTSFGFEGLHYETPYEFSGVEKSFQPSKSELWGGRIGIGGEIYLGAGLVTTTKVEGYYVGSLFARRLNAGPQDDDVEFAFTKRTGQVFGVDATQSIGFLFDLKTKHPIMGDWSYLTVQPYAEFGVGQASAYNRIVYDYDTGVTDEGYRMRVEDQLLNVRVGGGINFTSNTGYFLYLKAHVNTFDITKRKTEEYTRPNGRASTTVSETEKDVKIDPVTTYAIGGGFKF